MISIIIPVKNGGADLDRCLAAIARQACSEPVETLIADSGSTDNSREIARSHGVRVLEASGADFRHGATRNAATRETRGELVVFTSQDAYALDEHWLTRLAAAVRENERIAGAYGRQVPHDSARPAEEFFLDFLYGPEPRVQRAASEKDLTMRTTLFSNVNSAIPRPVWEKFSFAEDAFFGEDQDWARRVLLAGYEIRYEPAAAVRHSHTYTVRTALKRFFDTGASGERGFLAGGQASSQLLRREALRYAREELKWLVRTGNARWVPYTAAYELAKFVGVQLGARHQRLPLWFKRRVSFYPDYWDEVAERATSAHHTASAQKTNAASESRSGPK